jgi:hypothetical protein
VERVKDFASYLKRSPDTVKPENTRLSVVSASSGASANDENGLEAFVCDEKGPDVGNRSPFSHKSPLNASAVSLLDTTARSIQRYSKMMSSASISWKHR